MTNDEIRMSKAAGDGRLVGISGFGLLSDFVIRISSLSRASSHPLLLNYERFEIRLPATAEESRFHRRGRAHARARHRGEHGHLFCGERSLASRFAFPRF